MNNIENIKRIRWTGDGAERWYGVSISLRVEDKSTTSVVIWSPIGERNNYFKLTAKGIHIVNNILAMPGIGCVHVSPYGVTLTIPGIFTWADGYHAAIVALLNDTLFDGTADVPTDLTHTPPQISRPDPGNVSNNPGARSFWAALWPH